MMNSFNMFQKTFGVNMFYANSLPDFAQKTLMKLYNGKVPNIFTFHQKFPEIMELFRNNTYGGIVNVFHRHITLMDEPAPNSAKYNEQGIIMYKINII